MYTYVAGGFEMLDIESLFGPHWQKQMTDLCNILGGTESDYCKYFKQIPTGPISPGGTIFGYSEISVQQL